MPKNPMYKRSKPTLTVKICSYRGVVFVSMVIISGFYCSLKPEHKSSQFFFVGLITALLIFIQILLIIIQNIINNFQV